MKRYLLAAFAGLTLSGCATSTPTDFAVDRGSPLPPPEPVTVRIIGINDFHGNLEPLSRPAKVEGPDGQELTVPVAGAAAYASAIAKHRAQNAYSLVISAGDLISASPLISSLFLDEPTIGVMNRIGLDFNAVGNHEFDRGREELLRIQNGGCEKHTLREPCQVERPYPGASFPFLAANVEKEDGSTLFPASAIRRFGEGFDQVTVGVIGLTLKDTPTLVTPKGVEGLTFTDEAKAINDAVPGLIAQGADALIVAIHQGLYSKGGFNEKTCDTVSGPLLQILSQLDPRIDLVLSGHTHNTYVCDYSTLDPTRPFLVTSAGYGGAYLTDIELVVDPAIGDVIAKSADNIIVQNKGFTAGGTFISPVQQFPAFAADKAIADYVTRYANAAKDYAEQKVGRISAAAPEPATDTQETALGNLIADSQLAATREAGAQIAFMNTSGIRASLIPDAEGNLTFAQIYAAQPFGNTLETMSYSGAQLLALLEQQFDSEGFVQTFSVSQGFAMAYDLSRPEGSRVVSASLAGEPIDPARSYRVTMNSFLSWGGDTFTIFTQGTDHVTGPTDLDATQAWLEAVPMRQLPDIGRVTNLTPAE